MGNETYRELEDQEEILPGDQFLRPSGEWATIDTQDIYLLFKHLKPKNHVGIKFKYFKGRDLYTRRRI